MAADETRQPRHSTVVGFIVGIALMVSSGVETAPRWVGWLGLVAAAFGGWLGVLSPVSSIVEGVSSIGFLAFFVFMASLGVALLRRPAVPA